MAKYIELSASLELDMTQILSQGLREKQKEQEKKEATGDADDC